MRPQEAVKPQTASQGMRAFAQPGSEGWVSLCLRPPGALIQAGLRGDPGLRASGPDLASWEIFWTPKSQPHPRVPKITTSSHFGKHSVLFPTKPPPSDSWHLTAGLKGGQFGGPGAPGFTSRFRHLTKNLWMPLSPIFLISHVRAQHYFTGFVRRGSNKIFKAWPVKASDESCSVPGRE